MVFSTVPTVIPPSVTDPVRAGLPTETGAAL